MHKTTNRVQNLHPACGIGNQLSFSRMRESRLLSVLDPPVKRLCRNCSRRLSARRIAEVIACVYPAQTKVCGYKRLGHQRKSFNCDTVSKPEDDIYSVYKQGYFSRASTAAQLMFLKNAPI